MEYVSCCALALPALLAVVGYQVGSLNAAAPSQGCVSLSGLPASLGASNGKPVV